jgi:hypothetical protein
MSKFILVTSTAGYRACVNADHIIEFGPIEGGGTWAVFVGGVNMQWKENIDKIAALIIPDFPPDTFAIEQIQSMIYANSFSRKR